MFHGEWFLIFSVLAEGQKCCVSKTNSICGSLRVGKKRDACLCMRNGVLLDLKIATLLL